MFDLMNNYLLERKSNKKVVTVVVLDQIVDSEVKAGGVREKASGG